MTDADQHQDNGERIIGIDEMLQHGRINLPAGFDPFREGEARGMSAEMVKLALGLEMGLPQWKAAIAAGYKPSNPGSSAARSAASKTASSKKVRQFRERLREVRDNARGNEDTRPLSPQEEEALLAQHAREGGSSVALRAVIESIQLRREREEKEAKDEWPGFPSKSMLEKLRGFASGGVFQAIIIQQMADRYHVEGFDAGEALSDSDREIFISRRAAVQAALNGVALPTSTGRS